MPALWSGIYFAWREKSRNTARIIWIEESFHWENSSHATFSIHHRQRQLFNIHPKPMKLFSSEIDPSKLFANTFLTMQYIIGIGNYYFHSNVDSFQKDKTMCQFDPQLSNFQSFLLALNSLHKVYLWSKKNHQVIWITVSFRYILLILCILS